MNKEITIVTGLWDMGRGSLESWAKRDFSHYKDRFFEMLEKALTKPKVRKATKISKSANEKRIQEKKKAGEIKAGRKKLDY